MLWWIVIIVLVLLAVGAMPHWPYASGYNYGWGPAGGIGLVVLVILVLLVMGRL